MSGGNARAQELLRARARALARPLAEPHDDRTELLVARLGERRVGVPVLRAREVLPPGRIAWVPEAPAAIAGIRGVRGELVPVADLALLLGLERPAGPQHAVVLDHGAGALGLLVDAVDGVRAWRGRPAGAAPDRAGIVAAVIGGEADPVMVLDCDLLLADPRTGGAEGTETDATRGAA